MAFIIKLLSNDSFLCTDDETVSQKISYQARIPYPQHHELANKFSGYKKSQMCLVQEVALLVTSGMRLKTGVCGITSWCCFKKSAITEEDPCGGVEKHPTRTRYEYVLFMRRRCSCVVQAHSGYTGY